MNSVLTIGFLVMLTQLVKSLLLDNDAPCHERVSATR